MSAEVLEKAVKMPSPEKLYAEARAAGLAAAAACSPVPMVVQQHANVLDDNSPVVQQWVCDGGVCGFGWVTIRPARGKFVTWCKKQLLGSNGYHGGYEISVRDFNQSYEKKMAYAHAFAGVLQKYGINAYGDGRLD